MHLDVLRALALHSRRTLKVGFVAMAAVLLLFPTLGVVWIVAPEGIALATYVATAIAGAALVAFMYAAGKERGAFRKAMRDAKREGL